MVGRAERHRPDRGRRRRTAGARRAVRLVPGPGQDWISANIQTRCKISGDFDVQVDFHLLQWPSANGVHVDLAVADERALVRLNTGREEIVAWFPPQTSSIAHDELSGSYRIRRTGSWIYGYVLGEGGWYELGRAPVVRARRIRAPRGWCEREGVLAAAGAHRVRQLPHLERTPRLPVRRRNRRQ